VISISGLRWYYHTQELDKEGFIASTQKKLNNELKVVANDRQELVKYFADNKDLDFESLNQLNTTYPFYIFKNYALVYWSDEHYTPVLNKYHQEGWHFVKDEAGQFLELNSKSKNSNIILVTVIPVFEYYDISNEYIQSSFNTDLLPSTGIQLHQSAQEQSYALNDLDGNSIFHISFDEDFENYLPHFHYLIIILESLLAILLLYFLWHFASTRKGFWVKIMIYILGTAAIWGLVELFDFPFHSTDLELFDPKYFASSDFNPSLGNLVINCILFFLIGFFSIRKLKRFYSKEDSTLSNGVDLLLNIGAYLVTLGIYYFIQLIYIHSNWGLDSTQSIEFDLFELLSYVVVLLFGYLAFEVFRLVHHLNGRSSAGFIRFIVFQLIAFGLFLLTAFSFGIVIFWLAGIVLVVNVIVYSTRLGGALESLRFLSFIYLFILIIAISAISASSVYQLEKQKEASQRSVLADRIMNGNDLLAEYMLGQLDQRLKDDAYIKRQFLMPLTPYNTIVKKIEQYYLNEYFEKYEKSVRIFDAEGNSIFPSSLLPMSASYPLQQMNERNKRGDINLYLVSYNEGNQLLRKYIYVYEIKHYDFVFAKIVLEFKPKKIRPDNVFPELLVKNRYVSSLLDIPYDYALYNNDTLSYSVGNLNFPNVVSREISKDRRLLKIQTDQNINFSVVVNKDEKLIFSKKDVFWYRLFSNISFFFVISFVLVFIISVYQFIKLYWRTRSIGLSAKIQLYFSLAFLIPLLSVSISTIGFVNATFLKDIVTKYEENTNRVAGQLIPLLMEYENGLVDKTTLNNELSSITKIINTDINLYDLNGQLTVTSQPEVFEKNLLSNKINPKAYSSIVQNGQKKITLEEKVGNLNYQSAYVGIRSYNSGELLAILGSPFFKSNKEYEVLLTDLLNNVFNIFVGSFIVFIFLAYAVTKILTTPLNLLKQKLSQVNLSAHNKPITWQVDDEIGLLIKEYNQMLLKLEKSRLALSKTEKESAWREMAQQVAHEIKNPLTPMKLSLQHLQMKIQRADNNMPDATEKIHSILSQIENLSDIATSFSAFAKMPIPENENICISDILKRVVDLFQAENAQIRLDLPKEDIYVIADPKIMERTFNNMFINAMQSGDGKKPVSIEIKITLLENIIRISIADNGLGIPEDNFNKVFLPNFTTKSSGSGIGLAVAKRGVENAGGEIWFETEQNKGTTFFIELNRVV
jgi:nitrogen fixation/metabolism regulation signal transduction histidine kinase